MYNSIDPKVVAAVTHAVHAAIAQVGVEGLLKTSMFPSANKALAAEPLRLAA